MNWLHVIAIKQSCQGVRASSRKIYSQPKRAGFYGGEQVVQSWLFENSWRVPPDAEAGILAAGKTLKFCETRKSRIVTLRSGVFPLCRLASVPAFLIGCYRNTFFNSPK
jgi:hypothetical protein